MTTPWHRAYVRSRRDALTDTLQSHRIVLHLEKPLGTGQLRSRLGERRRVDAGAFDRRVQITEQPVHVFTGQIPCRMRFAEFAVQLGIVLLKTTDPGVRIFERGLQEWLLRQHVRVTAILGGTTRMPDRPLPLQRIQRRERLAHHGDQRLPHQLEIDRPVVRTALLRDRGQRLRAQDRLLDRRRARMTLDADLRRDIAQQAAVGGRAKRAAGNRPDFRDQPIQESRVVQREIGVFVLFVLNLAVFLVFSFQWCEKSLILPDVVPLMQSLALSSGRLVPAPGFGDETRIVQAQLRDLVLPDDGTSIDIHRRSFADPLHDPAMRRQGAASSNMSR
jgi:hypothetical protein